MTMRSLQSEWMVTILACLVSVSVGGCIFGSQSAEDVTAEQVGESLKRESWRGIIGGSDGDGNEPEAGFMADLLFLEGGNVDFFVGPIEVVGDWSVEGDGDETPFSVELTEFTVKTCHLDNTLYCAAAEFRADRYFEDTEKITLETHPGDDLPRTLAGTAPPSGDDEPAEIAATQRDDASIAPDQLVGDWSGTFGVGTERRLEIFSNSQGTKATAIRDGNEQYTGSLVVLEIRGRLYWGIRDDSSADEPPITGGHIVVESEEPTALKFPERDGVVSTLELDG